jgi:pyruvate dehydrogenase E1 component beta subunit
MPSSPADAKGLLKYALRQFDPVMFLEHKHLYMTKGLVPDGEHIVEFGKADIKRPGKDVTLIAWSNMVPTALAAAEELATQGIEAEVLDPRTLVPLDKAMILASVAKTKRAVIVQEANRRGGVASDICSIIQEELFYDLDAPIEIVAGLDIPIPFNLTLEKASVPQKSDVVAAARRTLHQDPLGLAAQ